EKLILGQTATSGDGGGWSNDGAQTMVRLDIRDSDCGQISETNYARILVPWVAWNYGPDAPVPTQAYDIEEAKDTQAEAEVVKTLGEAGWDLDPDQVEANTGYKVTAKEGPGVAEDGTASVSNTLNGAQLKSMVEVVQAVARKEIPRETAVSIITSGYAGIDRAAAEKILGPTGKSFFATVDVAALSAEDTAAGSALAFLLQAPGNGLALADQDRPADPPEAIAQAALPQARKATLAMFGPLQGRLDQIAAIESDTEFRAAVAAFSDEITQTADAVDTSDLETAMANTSHGSAAAGIAARAAEIKGKE
ncbi:MAG: DUF935 family protein, partial [Victivallales bacterium]|nr:DUF935 family protein [Victivallales bacterium]